MFARILIFPLLAFSLSVNALIVDFEEQPSSERFYSNLVIEEDGFQFSAMRYPGAAVPGYIGVFAANSQSPTSSSRRAANGTQTLRTFTATWGVLSHSFDSPFSITSIDLGEYSDVSFNNHAVEVTGFTTGGEILTTSFSLDGHVDGELSPPDFETFYFDSEWTDLSEIRIAAFAEGSDFATGVGIDNIVVSTVPVPSALLLFGSGLLGFLSLRFKKANSR